MFKTIEKINQVNDLEPVQEFIDIITNLLALECGYNDKQVNIRILSRLRDIIAQGRVIFLIKVLIDLSEALDQTKLDHMNLNNLLNRLFFLVYFVDVPVVYRVLMRLLIILGSRIDFSLLTSPYDLKYVYYSVKNIEEVVKQKSKLIQPVFQLIELKTEVPQQKLPLNNLTLCFEKLGQFIIGTFSIIRPTEERLLSHRH